VGGWHLRRLAVPLRGRGRGRATSMTDGRLRNIVENTRYRSFAGGIQRGLAPLAGVTGARALASRAAELVTGDAVVGQRARGPLGLGGRRGRAPCRAPASQLSFSTLLPPTPPHPPIGVSLPRGSWFVVRGRGRGRGRLGARNWAVDEVSAGARWLFASMWVVICAGSPFRWPARLRRRRKWNRNRAIHLLWRAQWLNMTKPTNNPTNTWMRSRSRVGHGRWGWRSRVRCHVHADRSAWGVVGGLPHAERQRAN